MVDTIQGLTGVQGLDPGPSTVTRGSRADPARATRADTSQGQATAGKVGDISVLVSALNDLVHEISATQITFDVDEATGQSVVRVLNKETGELIRQLPPEEILILAAKMKQLSGLIFSQEV